MKQSHFAALLVFNLLFIEMAWGTETNHQAHPNIVLILCDDLGYGDVDCLNPEHGKIQTPHIDQLANSGMTFTDAHSGSSVCTPTRYGLLTGRYSWRTKLQSGVVTGFAPCLIDEQRQTLASYLKDQGYHTACIGKWHLNFQYLDPRSRKPLKPKDYKLPPIGALIPDGPVDRGFDDYHGFHHARQMEAVIEDRTVIEHDEDKNMLPRLTQKAVEYIHLQSQTTQPFFLYLPLGSPHTPIVPTADWQGKSGLGDYADFVMQTDHTVGEVMRALKETQSDKNTLVILTSDNGCSKAAGIDELAQQGHLVSAGMRGSKADIWDGGHRVPFVIRWARQIKPQTTCTRLICLNDIFATLAALMQQPVGDQCCEDSISFLPLLRHPEGPASRTSLIHHSISGHFAFRKGNWKLILARGSGGWSTPTEKQVEEGTPFVQLYQMADDLTETNNLQSSQPGLVEQMLSELKTQIAAGRSTPGVDSYNDVNRIKLWKSGTGDQSSPFVMSITQ